MSKALLILIVSICLIVIGGGILKRTHMAVAPPVYDPITYYFRSAYVWNALAKGDINSLMNGPMSVRPPGTALVLYPFGFKPSIHSFLFRSVLAPILIWVIALTIPIVTRVSCWQDALVGSAIIVGLATMPLFYHFELNDAFAKAYCISAQWGLVDALEGAIAALALSLLCFAITNRNVKWCAVAWLVGGFSLFIKPSGVLVMMTLVGVAAAELLILFFGRDSNPRAFLKLAAPVYLIGFSVVGAALWAALASEYMSSMAIARSVKGQQIVLAMYEGREIFGLLAMFVVPVLGWWWFCPGVLFAGLIVLQITRHVIKGQWSGLGTRFVVAGMILVGAVFWWKFLAGQEHRYLFPFLLMIIAWFIPEIFQRVRHLELSARGAVIGYCLAPAVLLGAMLWSKQPAMIFQQLMGVNLSAGGYRSEVDQGKWLLAESQKLGRPLNIYSLGSFGAGVVEMVDWVEVIEKRDTPHRFVVKRPLSWVDASGLRGDDLVQSDFLLLEDIRLARDSESLAVSSWVEEVERFKQFAYLECGTDKNGLELVSEGRVKLLRVVSARKFSEAFCKWANSIHWANDFHNRNKILLENLQK